jgi:hypothetical protein
LCTARAPNANETAVLRGALDRLRKSYASDSASAKELVAVGESKSDPNIDLIELAAHTAVANLLLNLDETLSRE